MKKTAMWVAAMAVSAAACAQTKDMAAMEKYAKLVSPEFAKEQLTIIAADDMEGRETGKPGAEKAAQYLASQYKALGLLPANKGSYFLDVPLVQAGFKVNSFSVNGTTLTNGKDFTANGASKPKTVDVKDVVFVGYGGADELTTDIAGKVVVYIAADKPAKAGETPAAAPAGGRRGFGMSPARMAIVRSITDKKPALILAINPMMGGNNGGFGARGGAGGGRLAIKKDGPAVETPVTYTISPEVADQILKPTGKTFADVKGAIDGGAPQTQTVKTAINTSFASDDKDVMSKDIVAMIPGSDPKLKDEVLVFSAHYDHIGLNTRPGATDKVNNGADDDGSGTTGILAIARAFAQAKKDGHGPRRTILFLGNVGEEKGLLGSEYYTDHPIFPLANTITDLNIDMIGRIGDDYKGNVDSANYVFPIGSEMLSSTLKKVGEAMNAKYTHLKLDYRYDDINDKNRFYYRSDHYNFAKHGVPIVFYFNGTHPDYHQPGDEVSKINFPLLAKRAQLVFYTGWELANADKRPVVDGAAPANQ